MDQWILLKESVLERGPSSEVSIFQVLGGFEVHMRQG